MANPLLEQMVAAGLVDDRNALLAQKARRGQALMQTPTAQGMQVGGTYKAASPFEHLATLMARVTGGRQVRDAENEMRAGLDAKRAARTAYGEQFQGLPTVPSTEDLLRPAEQQGWSAPDLVSPQQVDGVTAPQKTPAEQLVDAIDARSRLGGMAALSGDPALMASGQGLTTEARGLGQTASTIALGNRQFGLDTQRLAQTGAAQRAEQEYRDRVLAESSRHNLAVETTDNWSAVADPVTGGIVAYNKKTGEVRPLGPGGGTPAPVSGGPARPPPLLPGKPTEAQRKAVAGASESITQLDMAIDALNKAPGAYGGAGNFIAGLAESAGGTPVQSLTARRYEPEELRVKNYVSNVVSKIINERAGANVTLREELRQKFLPQDTDGLDQAKQKLSDLRAMMAASYEAQAGGVLPPPGEPPSGDAAPTRIPVTRNGVTRYWNGTGWED